MAWVHGCAERVSGNARGHGQGNQWPGIVACRGSRPWWRQEARNAVFIQGVSLGEPWRLLHGGVRASPDVLTSWLLQLPGWNQKSLFSCSVPPAPSAEKAQHHAHCEGEMLKRIPSVNHRKHNGRELSVSELITGMLGLFKYLSFHQISSKDFSNKMSEEMHMWYKSSNK